MKLTKPYDLYEVVARLKKNRVKVNNKKILLPKGGVGIRVQGYIDFLVHKHKHTIVTEMPRKPRRKPSRRRSDRRRQPAQRRTN